ncbi:hypothetical protein GG344DRAFT_83858 [Lentinula edodes]|nr:hypothetical protein GG344DRAFT_83858 [Lentinula edodes]
MTSANHNTKKAAAARARAGHLEPRDVSNETDFEESRLSGLEDDLEELADMLQDLDLWDPADGPMDMGKDSDSEIEELQGEELVKSLEEKEAQIEYTFAQLMRDKSKQEWKQADVKIMYTV